MLFWVGLSQVKAFKGRLGSSRRDRQPIRVLMKGSDALSAAYGGE